MPQSRKDGTTASTLRSAIKIMKLRCSPSVALPANTALGVHVDKATKSSLSTAALAFR